MKRFILYLVASMALSFGLLACGGGSSGGNNGKASGCQTNDDCAADAQCFAGACVTASEQQCTSDLDCAEYEYCGTADGKSTCQLSSCSTNDDCAANAVCDGGTCRAGCRTNDDCEAGKRCSEVTMTCVQAGCTPGSCGAHRNCDDSRDPPQCVYDGSCGTDNDCIGYAHQLDDGKTYLCVDGACQAKPPCAGDQDCGAGEICIDVQDGDNYCTAGCRSTDDCLVGEYCNDQLKCVAGCQADADCSGENQVCVDLECARGCTSRDDCEAAGMVGYVCTGTPTHCQMCTNDNQCYGSEFCNKDADGTPGGQGLCQDLPPECPDDGFGDNHSRDNAFAIDQFPFDKTADAGPLFCRQHAGGEWFSLSADPGKVVSVEIQYDNTAGNLDLALVDSAGNDLMTSSRPPAADNGVERIVYGINPQNSGPVDLFIHVRGTPIDPAVPYSLSVDVADPQSCADDGYEPNNTTADAKPIEGNNVAHNDLEVCGDDADFYSLDVQANQIVTVAIQAPPRLGEVEAFLNKDGQTVATAAPEQNNALVQRITYATQEAGTLILEVRVKNGAGKAVYDLAWSTTANVCTDPLEPNDVCADATPVQSGTTYANLNICEDSDYYAITLRPLDRIRATAAFDPANAAGELQLTLFGPNDCGAFKTSAVEQDVPNSTERELVIADPNDTSQGYQVQLGGTYYILASRFSGIRVPYSLAVDVQAGPACVDDGSEPNDDAASATVIDETQVVNNGPQSALLGLKTCDYNEDWYTIDIQDGETLKWEIVQDSTNGAIDAELIDSDGTTPVVDANNDPIKLDANGDIQVTNNSGATKTYYLKVAGANGLPVRNDYWLLTFIDGSGTTDTACPDVYENNDDSSSAQELAAGSYSNLLVCGGDDDWYKTLVHAGETVNVTASFDNARGNIDLRLFEDSDLTRPKLASATSADTETLSYTTARDQYVYYKVTTGANVAGNDYTLDVSIDAAPTCNDDGMEDNDSAGSATQVDAPGLYTRLMSCENDDDWYAVTLTAGQLFEADINYDGTRADLDVSIYDPADLSAPAATGDAMAQFTPSADGTYYVRVASADPSVGVRLGYDLMLYRDLNNNGSIDLGDEGPADKICPDAYENNDTFNTAVALPAGSYDNLLSCWGSPVIDPDYYKVYVPAGATLTVDLTFTNADGNIDVQLKDAQNQIVDSGTTSTDNESVSTTNSTSVGATYYIEVRGATGSFHNYYRMDIGLQFATQCAGDQFDPNGDQSTAKTLTAGNYALSLCEGTEDWYTFDLADGQSFEAHAELRNRLGDIDMALQDGSGTVLKSSTSATDLESIQYTNSTGASQTLYLRVFPKNGAFMRNDYDLWTSIAGNAPTVPYCPDAYERNDTTESAYAFDFATQPELADAIMCGEEEDWYQVDLRAAQQYDLAAFFDQASNYDLALEVRDENGNLVADGNGNDISFANDSSTSDEFASFTPSASGTYFLGVKQKGGDPTAQGDYGLYFDSHNALCPEDSYEPNDRAGQAKALPDLGTYALGSCGSPTGTKLVDIFTYTPTAAGAVTFTVYFDSSKGAISGYVNALNHQLDTTVANRATYTVPAADVTVGSPIFIDIESDTGKVPYFLKISQ